MVASNGDLEAGKRQASLYLILSSIPTLTNYSSYTIWIIKLCAQNSKWGSKHRLTYRQPVHVKPACLTQSCNLSTQGISFIIIFSLLNSFSIQFCNSFHLMEHWFSYLLKQWFQKMYSQRRKRHVFWTLSLNVFSMCLPWFKPGSPIWNSQVKSIFFLILCFMLESR